MVNRKLECCGSCSRDGACRGKVRLVEVFDYEWEEKSWGKFPYCQTAIDIDTNNGFFVKPVEQKGRTIG